MKKILSIFVCILCILPLSAQTTYSYEQINPDTVTGLRHYKGGDNWFISLQGGANMSMSENVRPRDWKDAIGWSGALSIGKWFSPQVGARIQGGLMSQHGLANEEAMKAYPQYYGDGVYGFKNVYGYLDAMLNLNNIFSQYKESRKFDVIGLFGIGANHIFDLDKGTLNRWASAPAPYKIHAKNGTYLAIRAGFLFNWQIAKAWDLGLELTMNATNDKYNGIVYDDKYDGYVNALLGFTYHFKDHFGDHRFKYRTLNDYDEWEALNNRINAARAELDGIKPAKSTVAVQERFLDMTISFIIDKSDITDIQRRNVEAVAIPEVGEVYEGTVRSIMPYGCFVEIMPGKDGLLHISEIDWKRLETVEEAGIKEGDKIKVKLLEIDPKTGKYKLSHRVLIEKPEGYVERPARERGERRERPERGERRDRRPDRGDRRNGDRRERPERHDHHEEAPRENAAPKDFSDSLDDMDF